MVELVTVEFSKSEFMSWLRSAKCGQSLIYHVGYLYTDRVKNKKLNALAHALYAEAVAGTVHLKQLRLAPLQYTYLAEKR